MEQTTLLQINNKNDRDGYNIQVLTKEKNVLGKRLLDLVICLLAIFFVIPIIVFTAFLIKLETKGPAFYVQERLGLGGKVFKIIKLRSMNVDAEKNGISWTEKNDPRVTKIGQFIRKTRIDELPQILNIFKGEMTLIGPRPERPEFTAKFEEEIPGFINRLSVMPGVTGWAQVNGGYDISLKEKLDLDMEYIEKQSLKVDLLILVKTFRIVITGEGAR